MKSCLWYVCMCVFCGAGSHRVCCSVWLQLLDRKQQRLELVVVPVAEFVDRQLVRSSLHLFSSLLMTVFLHFLFMFVVCVPVLCGTGRNH